MKSLRESLRSVNESDKPIKSKKFNLKDPGLDYYGEKPEITISRYPDYIEFNLLISGNDYWVELDESDAKQLANYFSKPEKAPSWQWSVGSEEGGSINIMGLDESGKFLQIEAYSPAEEGESDAAYLTFKECKDIAKYILSLI